MPVSFRKTKAFAVNAPVLVGCSQIVGMFGPKKKSLLESSLTKEKSYDLHKLDGYVFCFSFCPVTLSLYSSGLVPANIKMEKYDFDLILGRHLSCACLFNVYVLMIS